MPYEQRGVAWQQEFLGALKHAESVATIFIADEAKQRFVCLQRELGAFFFFGPLGAF